jgi:hypothetical protein
MATHFSILTFSYNGPQGETPTLAAPARQRAFNTGWVNFDSLDTSDPIYIDGRRSKVDYFPGGNPANSITYYTNHTLDELVDLANAGTSS